MTLDELKAQRDATMHEYETAKATMYRTDGALSLLDHLIQAMEAAVVPPAASTE